MQHHYGSLDDTDFDLGGTTYTVKSVRWGTLVGQVRLHLTLDQDFPLHEPEHPDAEGGRHEFALSSASRLPGAASNNYRWDSKATIRAYEGREVTVQVIQDPRPGCR